MYTSQVGARFHHTGFVVASIAAVMENFRLAVGGRNCSQTWHDPLQGVRVAFIEPGHLGDPSIELVEPAGPDSPVEKFLRRGGGLHHLCYEVEALDQAARFASAQGSVLIRRPQPSVAFGGRRISWFLTRQGLLIEYLERV